METERYKTRAIIIANAMSYATPSSDATSMNKKQKAWKQFIDAFDWDKMTEKKENKPTLQGFLAAFKSTGVVTKGGKRIVNN